MATNEIYIDASPERVFDVLSNPRSYGTWVVGSHSIRAADPEWPAPGAAFDHRVGVGPLTLSDHTSVISADPPRAIDLLARASPLPPQHVKLRLNRRARGTQLIMEEAPASRLLSLALGPLGHWLLWLRNIESLRRLKLLVEGDAPLSTERLPERDDRRNG